MEEYVVDDFSIGGDITLHRLTHRSGNTPVNTITVVKGSGTSIEHPIGDDALIYVGRTQFKSLKDDLKIARERQKELIVRYASTPKPSRQPTYEEISDFSHDLV